MGRGRIRALIAALAVIFALVPAGPVSAATGDPVLLNEVFASHTGTDDTEFIELYGDPGASLAGLSVIVVESDATGNGTIDRRIDFGAGDELGSNGFLLIGNPAGLAANYAVAPNVEVSNNFLENSSLTVAIVETSSLAGASVVGTEVVLDAVGLSDGDAEDGFFFGAPVVGPDGSFFPAGVRRVADGVDSDAAGDWEISAFGLGDANTPTAGSFPSPIVISELRIDQPGSDNDEYFELAGDPGTSLDGHTYVVIGDGAGGSGVVESVTDLTGQSIDVNGFFVAAEGTFSLGSANLISTLGFENSDNVTHLLVRDFTGNLSDDLDTDDDGVLDATPWSTIVDSVALIETVGSGDQVYSDNRVGPDGSFVPGHVYQCGDGFVIGSFAPSGGDTPGAENCPPSPCEAGVVLISVIQGDGSDTPCGGTTVTVQGVVVGDYEGSAPNLRGFYVQEEDADHDGDPATSEGVFVFNGSDDDVALGDLVTVSGTVSEFFGQTQISADSVVVDASGFSVTPALASLPLTSSDALERFEGMLVEFEQSLVVTEFFQLGRFGQVVVSSGGRLDQPTDVAEPGPDAAAIQAANDLNRLIIDDATNDQNPEAILIGRQGGPLDVTNPLRGGDVAQNTIGVLTYTWAGNGASGNAYRLRPFGALNGHLDFQPTATTARPTSAPDVGGTLTVAAFNVLNYFTTIDAGPDVCGADSSQDCRGADSVFEFERQRAKVLAALTKLDGDVVGLIELENTPGAEPLADLVEGLNAAVGAGTYDFVDTGVIGGDAIKVGFIFKPASVTPIGDFAVLDSSVDARFLDTKNRPALAQTFLENATGEVFTVVNNHFKSKGSSCDDVGDPTDPNGQGNCNGVRTAAAEALADWIAGDPTNSGDTDVLIVGDLNSYAEEDPIKALEAAGFVDLNDEYTYVFNGQWGHLDYVMASASLAGQVVGASSWHINADEPSVLDYNTNFKPASQIEALFAPDEFRSSDHDPVVAGLALGSGYELHPSQAVLWPPNHKMRVIGLTASGSDGVLEVEVVSVVSSEADSGLGEDDVPNDVRIIDGDLIEVRAERFSKDGRTYTISAWVSGDGQTVLAASSVKVLFSQRKMIR